MLKVETFEVPKHDVEKPEDEVKIKALVETLGLDGQQKPLTEHAYRQMTRDEAFVYGVLLNIQKDLRTFDTTPIPLKVLLIVNQANSLGIFKNGLQVWYSSQQKDYLLVGKIDYSTAHILARWGEDLESFEILMKKALIKNKNAVISRLMDIQARINAQLDIVRQPDHNAKQSLPTYYCEV